MQPNEHVNDSDARAEQAMEENLARDEESSALEQVLEDEMRSASHGADSTEAKLAEAEREVLRARAELENFRKRMQRDAEQQLKYANVPLVRDLLEVIDNLKRATEAANQESASADTLREGVEMVAQQLSSVLAKYGCRPIESLGSEFDPNYHEAIAQMPSEEFAAGQVAQEVAVGYLLHDRVVRPSNVIVSTGTAAQ